MISDDALKWFKILKKFDKPFLVTFYDYNITFFLGAVGLIIMAVVSDGYVFSYVIKEKFGK